MRPAERSVRLADDLVVERIEALTLRPDDVLVLTVTGVGGAEELQAITEMFLAERDRLNLPPGVQILVMTDNMALSALRPPTEGAR
jgi:hypothetical protein